MLRSDGRPEHLHSVGATDFLELQIQNGVKKEEACTKVLLGEMPNAWQKKKGFKVKTEKWRRHEVSRRQLSTPETVERNVWRECKITTTALRHATGDNVENNK